MIRFNPYPEILLSAAILFGLIAYPAGSALAAEELMTQSILPLSMAGRAAQAAREKCEKDGYHVSVAVVDQDGVTKILTRGDGAGPHTTDSSRKKAYTAASIRRPTTELANLIVRFPQLQALREMNPNILILGGGLPIVIAGEVVGGIGVGGAPGALLDEDCAKAGLEAIGALVEKPAGK